MLDTEKAAASSGFAASIARGWRRRSIGVVNTAGVQVPDHLLLRESGLSARLTGKVTGLRRFEGLPPLSAGAASRNVFLLWFFPADKGACFERSRLLCHVNTFFPKSCAVFGGQVSGIGQVRPGGDQLERMGALQVVWKRAQLCTFSSSAIPLYWTRPFFHDTIDAAWRQGETQK